MSGLCGKELMNLRQNTFENIVGKGEMPVTSILSVFHSVFHLLSSFPNQISLFFFFSFCCLQIFSILKTLKKPLENTTGKGENARKQKYM